MKSFSEEHFAELKTKRMLAQARFAWFCISKCLNYSFHLASLWLTLSVNVKVVSRIPRAQACKFPISVLNQLRQISDQEQWWCHLKIEFRHLPNEIKVPSKDQYQPNDWKMSDRVQLLLQRFHGDHPKLDRESIYCPCNMYHSERARSAAQESQIHPRSWPTCWHLKARTFILLFWLESNTNVSSTFLLKKKMGSYHVAKFNLQTVNINRKKGS